MEAGFLRNIFRKKKVANAKVEIPFAVRESDIFIVSYPKSGNTWVRFLIGNYITENNFSFLNSNEIIPDMHAHPEKCEKLTGTRIIKSHFSYTPEFKKVIYIVRDARDVAVSYYYYYLKYVHNKQAEKPVFDNFLDDFLKGNVGFGAWDTHVNSWLDNSPGRFLLLRYEDLITNTETVMKEILTFIYGTYDEAKMLKAIEASAFEQMAEREQKERMQLPRNAASDPSIPFVRKGQPGDYGNYFTKEREDELLSHYKNTLRRLKYTHA